jgi:hypothetical protein
MYKEDKIYINHALYFTHGKVRINGETIFEQEKNENYIALSKRIFNSLDKPYPKFHKMDRISKLAYLSGDLLMNQISLDSYNSENIALIFSNSSATIETDIKFQHSISEIPSPAIFVYTLPNIMVGELCIRFGLKGENLFFVEPQFNPRLLTEQAHLLFANSQIELCILAWVDFYSPEDYSCFMCLVSKENKGAILSAENLNSYFK